MSGGPEQKSTAAGWPQHLAARVTHARRGSLSHAFRYTVDYLLLDPEADSHPKRPGKTRPWLLRYERFGLVSYHARDHGGRAGPVRARSGRERVLRASGLAHQDDITLRLLTQPRFLGVWFTPVSFWLALRDGQPVAMIAEVNNTFGQRHSYLIHEPGFAPLDAQRDYTAQKVFHVSPFQDVAGEYRFRICLDDAQIRIAISHVSGAQGLVACMSGQMRPASNARLLGAAIRRPVWPLRVLALIHWHALRLWLKGAVYRPVPTAPDREVSQ